MSGEAVQDAVTAEVLDEAAARDRARRGPMWAPGEAMLRALNVTHAEPVARERAYVMAATIGSTPLAGVVKGLEAELNGYRRYAAARIGTIPVRLDPDLEYEGECVTWPDFNGRPWPSEVLLREPNERVLLHETLHAVIGSTPDLPREMFCGTDLQETLVRRITAALYDEMGWRPPTLEPTP